MNQTSNFQLSWFAYEAWATLYMAFFAKTTLWSLIFDLEMSSFHQNDQKNVIDRVHLISNDTKTRISISYDELPLLFNIPVLDIIDYNLDDVVSYIAPLYYHFC